MCVCMYMYIYTHTYIYTTKKETKCLYRESQEINKMPSGTSKLR